MYVHITLPPSLFVAVSSVVVYMYLCFIYTTDVWGWIENMRGQVCDLEHRVRLVKANVEHIFKIMAGWSHTPLYQRKEDKKDCLLNLEVHLRTYVAM